MKTETTVQRRAARAMKQAQRQGVDPRNTQPQYAKQYRRLMADDIRREEAKAAKRKPWTRAEAIAQWEADLDTI